MDTQNNDSLPALNETTKLEYEGEMEHKLKGLGKKIDDLIDKADDSKANSIAALKIEKAQAENSLQALKAAGKEAWSAISKFNKDRAAGQN